MLLWLSTSLATQVSAVCLLASTVTFKCSCI